MTLPELQKKYPKARHAPDPNCTKCEGKGEWWHPYEGEFFKAAYVPCACIFIDHDLLPIFRETMGKTIKKLKQELEG